MSGLDYLLEVLTERGLTIHISAKRKPSLRGPKEEVTAALKEMLAEYREEILERFGPKQWIPREWLWKDGHRFIEEPADEWYWGHSERNPAGAWWWRHQGESDWQIVEGILHVAAIGAECLRQGDGLPPGEHLEGMLSGPRRPDTVTGALVGT